MTRHGCAGHISWSEHTWRVRTPIRYISGMKGRTLAILAGALAVVAVAFALHFELNARARAYSELRGLRTETATESAHHRISPSQAAALESRLSQARLQIEEDDVRSAQRLLDGIKADLVSDGRSA